MGNTLLLLCQTQQNEKKIKAVSSTAFFTFFASSLFLGSEILNWNQY
jgi:hypothetical protein